MQLWEIDTLGFVGYNMEQFNDLIFVGRLISHLSIFFYALLLRFMCIFRISWSQLCFILSIAAACRNLISSLPKRYFVAFLFFYVFPLGTLLSVLYVHSRMLCYLFLFYGCSLVL